jgi:predicted dehydrogenase
MTRVGIVGLGFMGMVHYLSYQKTPGVQVVAICESDERRRSGDWRGIKGNFGPAGEQIDLSGVNTFAEIDAMLAEDDIDLVDVTLPPSLHAEVSIKALDGGRHVFCEKPMSLSPDECRRMAEAAQRTDRRLLIGHVLPYFPEFRWALEVVRSGKYGQLLGGSFKRVIADPAWLTNYWQADKVGGPMLDLHVHDAHFIRLLFGMPEAVASWGRMKHGLAEHWHTQFDYGEIGPVVHSVSGTIDQQGRGFNHGFEIQLEQAILAFEFAVAGDQASYLCPPTLFKNDGSVERPELSGGDPMEVFAEEIKAVVQDITSQQRASCLEAGLGLDAITICQAEHKSLQERARVEMRA